MKIACPTAFFSLMFFVYSCTNTKYAATNKTYRLKAKQFAKLLREYPLKDSSGLNYVSDWAGTTNLSMRKPNFVIIHHTAQNSCGQTVKTFTTQDSRAVSAHYVICRDGTVHHMLNDLLRAHHAGVGKWGNVSDMNSCSIGIEIDNNGNEPFSDTQMNSLLLLLDRLKKAYSIPQANFIGHLDWAPGRKNDPSRFFSWKILADKGFGYWYDTTSVQVPADFNAINALRIIGYNVVKPVYAIESFKIHFTPQDTTKVINEADRKILFDLVKKYQ
ncbi:MAG: N-acetylmuramoyl-L-alanine amidase [Sphingobacteriales bacterium]|nr:N-acetylmuramoyl-L-alanine amidase [Sphingobacteriales bacterium]